MVIDWEQSVECCVTSETLADEVSRDQALLNRNLMPFTLMVYIRGSSYQQPDIKDAWFACASDMHPAGIAPMRPQAVSLCLNGSKCIQRESRLPCISLKDFPPPSPQGISQCVAAVADIFSRSVNRTKSAGFEDIHQGINYGVIDTAAAG